MQHAPESGAPTPSPQPAADPDAPASADAAQDSAAFLRCAACRYASDLDRAAGSLLCLKHNMLCEAESGAIPDDCAEFETPDPSES